MAYKTRTGKVKIRRRRNTKKRLAKSKREHKKTIRGGGDVLIDSRYYYCYTNFTIPSNFFPKYRYKQYRFDRLKLMEDKDKGNFYNYRIDIGDKQQAISVNNTELMEYIDIGKLFEYNFFIDIINQSAEKKRLERILK